MKKSALLVGLFVLGILVGLSLRNPFRGEAGYSPLEITLSWKRGYCFAVHRDSGSITFIKETGNESECKRIR